MYMLSQICNNFFTNSEKRFYIKSQQDPRKRMDQCSSLPEHAQQIIIATSITTCSNKPMNNETLIIPIETMEGIEFGKARITPDKQYISVIDVR